ncbi:hypothetical protein [Nocardia farcinica]|uniref:hypothetical protein n=1 Tax=Nocardia farcinica TaxID=37329 RepID=UPI001893D160|nr:hypothetical protein [Nocardia farcinica]MBF6254456.1 hypothetical protein [Nocardia farcinica]
MSGPNDVCQISDLDREVCPHCQPEPAPAPEPAAPSEPGLYAGVPEAVYHGDRRSLSSSGARRLLEVTPHRWRWEQDHPRPASDEMEWGSAVHTLVLGAGPPPVDTGFDRWQWDCVDRARAAGLRVRAKVSDAILAIPVPEEAER